MGIKLALGFNPTSTTEWKGERPSTRMGAMANLRDNLIRDKNFKIYLIKTKEIMVRLIF
jgi:hypothetical protein